VTIYRRADALEAGDIIDDQGIILKVIEATTTDDDRVTLTTEINRWGIEAQSTWSVDYRREFKLWGATATSRLVTNPCIVCGARSEMVVPLDGYIEWKKGALIQDAFPDMDADNRELVKTGTHPQCWDMMFPEEEES
jgi:hypothetical protein